MTEAAPGALPGTIRLSGVSRWYGNVVAVNDVSFDIGPGLTGLLGPNGAGKTTILHMISGFLAPSTGEVTLDGTPTWGHPELYRRIGLVPERESIYAFLSGRDFVRAAADLHHLTDAAEATERAIRMVDLLGAADRPVGTYSKGMRQRIKVAGAFVHDPPVLILDEPFNGMDPRQRLQTMTLLRRMAAEGRTILFSSHILEEVERLAERVLVIVGGRLAASGDFREIRRLMTDRPHTFSLRSSNDRALAAAVLGAGIVSAAELLDGSLTVRTDEFGAFARLLPDAARQAGVTLYEVLPADESLESVFSYLVAR